MGGIKGTIATDHLHPPPTSERKNEREKDDDGLTKIDPIGSLPQVSDLISVEKKTNFGRQQQQQQNNNETTTERHPKNDNHNSQPTRKHLA